MPKPKPNEIIRHEIVLGRSERDLVESMILTQGVKATFPPLVDVFKDPAALYALLIVVERITGIQIPGVISSKEDAMGVITAYYDALTAPLRVEGRDTEEMKNYKTSLNNQVENGEITVEEAKQQARDYKIAEFKAREKAIAEQQPTATWGEEMASTIDDDIRALATRVLGGDAVAIAELYRGLELQDINPYDTFMDWFGPRETSPLTDSERKALWEQLTDEQREYIKRAKR
jgi:hypothetical protein